MVDPRGNPVIQIKFATKDCRACVNVRYCIRSTKKYPRRLLTIHPKEQYEALQKRRKQEKTAEYAREYARRAGVEGTISQGVRRCGMRRSRYLGAAKTHLDNVLTAAALNFVRVGA